MQREDSPASVQVDNVHSFVQCHRWHSFADKHMQQLYELYTSGTRHSNVLHALTICAVLTVALAVLPLADARTLLNTNSLSLLMVAALFVLSLCALLKLGSDHKRSELFGNCLSIGCLCVLVIVSLPLPWTAWLSIHTPTALRTTDGVWQVLLVTFVLHTSTSLPVPVTVIVSGALALCQMMASVFIDSHQQSLHSPHLQQLLAHSILYIWMQLLCVFFRYSHERQVKEAFLQSRRSIIAKMHIQHNTQKMDHLLACVLPVQMAVTTRQQLSLNRKNPQNFIRKFENCSVLFADFTNFGQIVAQSTTHELVSRLNELVGQFDILAQNNNCSRVKLFGDVYMAVCGIDQTRADHAVCATNLAQDIIDVVNCMNGRNEHSTASHLQPRVGVHSGSVMCALLGTVRCHYDVWSTTVNYARTLQSTTQPGRVHVSADTARLLDGQFDLEHSNLVTTRGVRMNTYFVIPKPGRKKCDLSMWNSLNSSRLSAVSSGKVLSRLQALHNGGMLPFTDTAFPPASLVTHDQPTNNRIFKRNTLSSAHVESMSAANQHVAKCLTEQTQNDKPPFTKWTTLQFNNDTLENQYKSGWQNGPSYVLSVLVASLLLFGAIHLLVLPLSVPALLIYLVAVLLHVMVLILTQLSTKCVQLKGYVTQYYYGQLLVSLLLFCTFCLWPIVNFLSCSSVLCVPAVPYVLVSCVMCMVTLCLFTRLPALLQLCIMCLLLTIYAAGILAIWAQLYAQYELIDSTNESKQLEALVVLCAFMVLAYLVSRRAECWARLCFVWTGQAEHDATDAKYLQRHNQHLVQNMLPAHVACHYLGGATVSAGCNEGLRELYSCSYPQLGVLFANLCNLGECYAELDVNNDAIECMRVLNLIVTAFDQMLDVDRFKSIEKVKTSGDTYMVVIGLQPTARILDTKQSVGDNMEILAEFALALTEKLHAINRQSFRSFSMKIGIDVGPAVAGVVGGHKPQFDVYGHTVSRAYRLHQSCLPDLIQTSDAVFGALHTRPFKFQSRVMTRLGREFNVQTYLLTGKRLAPAQTSSSERSKSSHSQSSTCTQPVASAAGPVLEQIAHAKHKIQTALASTQPISESELDEQQPLISFQQQTPQSELRSKAITRMVDASQTDLESDVDQMIEMSFLMEDTKEIEQLQNLLKNSLQPFMGKTTSANNKSNAQKQPATLLDASAYSDGEHLLPKPQQQMASVTTNQTPATNNIQEQLPKMCTLELGDVTDEYAEPHSLRDPPTSISGKRPAWHPSTLPKHPAPAQPRANLRKRIKKKFKRLIPEPATTSQSDLEFVDASVLGYMNTATARNNAALLRQKCQQLEQNAHQFNGRHPVPNNSAAPRVTNGHTKSQDDSLIVISSESHMSSSEDEAQHKPTPPRPRSSKSKSGSSHKSYSPSVSGSRNNTQHKSAHNTEPNEARQPPVHQVIEQLQLDSSAKMDNPPVTSELPKSGINGLGAFPTDYQAPYFLETPIMRGDTNTSGRPISRAHYKYRRSAGQLMSGTEYENADFDTDFVFSDAEEPAEGVHKSSQELAHLLASVAPWNMHRGISMDRMSSRMVRDDSCIGAPLMSRSRHPVLRSIDYLALDTGHDGDVDSILSSRASSRAFIGHQFVSARSVQSAYDQPNANVQSASSSIHVHMEPQTAQPSYIQLLTNDIRQSFGDYKLASFSDLNNSE